MFERAVNIALPKTTHFCRKVHKQQEKRKKEKKKETKLTPSNDVLVAVTGADGQLIFQMNQGMRVFPSIQML